MYKCQYPIFLLVKFVLKIDRVYQFSELDKNQPKDNKELARQMHFFVVPQKEPWFSKKGLSRECEKGGHPRSGGVPFSISLLGLSLFKQSYIGE